MAGKSNTFEYYTLAMLLTATAIPNVSQNGASPLTAVWVSLHTADPGEANEQGTSEANYGAYTRIAVTRSTVGWSVSTAGGNASPVSAITFPQANTTSTMTITHMGIGATSASTASLLFYSGAVSPTIAIGQNVTPRLTTGSSLTED